MSGELLNEDDFREVQATRFSRVSPTVDQGRRTCSVSMKDTTLSRTFVDYSLGSDRLIFSLIVKNTNTGPTIDGIPVPKRQTQADSCQEGQKEGSRGTMWAFAPIIRAFCCVFLLRPEVGVVFQLQVPIYQARAKGMAYKVRTKELIEQECFTQKSSCA